LSAGGAAQALEAGDSLILFKPRDADGVRKGGVAGEK